MEDIICTVPTQCGEKDCSVGWHIEHYWAYPDGTYTVCDSDGNHDPCDAKDVPSADAAQKLWREYSAHVAATGDDPLSEFTIPRSVKRTAWYDFQATRSIVGPVFIVKPHKRGGYRRPTEMGQAFADFFACDSLDEIQESEDVKITRRTKTGEALTLVRGRARVERTIPRSEHAVRRDLVRAARRHLRRELPFGLVEKDFQWKR